MISQIIVVLLALFLSPSNSFQFSCKSVTYSHRRSRTNNAQLYQHGSDRRDLSDSIKMNGESSALFSKVLTFNIVSFSLIAAASAAEGGDADAVLFVAKPVLDIFINVMNLLFLSRVIISWYPKTNKG